ncbi:MAG: sigma 54-interacting transcriptional regulator, partial [Myxococcota bacterium]
MSGGDVLIVDDEPGILRTLSTTLELEGYEVRTASTAAEAQAALARREPDLLLLDVKLPDGNGLQLLDALGPEGQLPFPVVVISGNASIEDAVRALQLGAETYLEKPPESERLLRTVDNAIRRRRLEVEVESLRESAGGGEILGASPAIERLRDQIERVAVSEGWVLVTGENGTGKELVARAIHEQSPRASRPFVSLNCAAVPAELIESELFGHEKGAFTGAHARKIGKFERAHRGTLFLDE